MRLPNALANLSTGKKVAIVVTAVGLPLAIYGVILARRHKVPDYGNLPPPPTPPPTW